MLLLMLLGGLACGCAHTKAVPPQAWEDPAALMASVPENPPEPGQKPAATPLTQTLIVTPENPLVGKVTTVNQTAGFVVLSFPVGHMPPIDQRLSVYRKGLKVGEVKITGPKLDENVVADVVAGDAEASDEVK